MEGEREGMKGERGRETEGVRRRDGWRERRKGGREGGRRRG